MGFGRKMGAFLGLVPDDGRGANGFDDEYGHGEYDYGRDYGTETAGHRDPGYDYRGDEDFDRQAPRADSGFAPEPITQGALAMQPRLEPRRDLDTKAGSRPVTIKLTGFAEARVIGEKYRDGQSVIMDMTDMSDSDARRLVDFAAGLAFAKRGSIDKVTAKVFMLLPSDMDFELSADDRREYATAYAR